MAKTTKKVSGRARLKKTLLPHPSKKNYPPVPRIVDEEADTIDSNVLSGGSHSSLGARIIISLVALLVIVVLGLFFAGSFSGKAIETPQAEIVSFDTMDSEKVLISAFDVIPFDFMVTPSKSAGAAAPIPLKLRLTMSMDERDMFHYQLNLVAAPNRLLLLGKGLLGRDVLSMDGVYVNNDDIADLALALEGPYIRITNLNYVTPEAATINRVTFDTQVVLRDAAIIPVVPAQKIATMFHINSTALPSVAFVWQNGSDVVEAVQIGGNASSVVYALNWTPEVARGSVPFIVTAQVDREYSEKQYIMAVGGVEYVLLNNDGTTRLEMFRENGVLKARYTLAASGGLQPLMAPCAGFPALSSLADKITTIYGYDSRTQQWRNGVPSEFGNLMVGRGYLVRLAEGQSLDVTYSCGGQEGAPDELPTLRSGWNLISFSGSTVRDAELLVPPVGTQIRLVFEVTPTRMIPDVPLDSLDPGRVYWVKVQ